MTTPSDSPNDSPSDSREVHGWVMYDWANSVFGSTVLTAFFGPYIATLIENQPDGKLEVLGFSIESDALYPFCVSLSVLLQVIFLPILGTLADYTPLKKKLLLGFAYAGGIATTLMFFVQDDTILFGGVLFIFANLCFGVSLVFYNAYLPDIAGPGDHDEISSRGFAVGYLGGGLLLAMNVGLAFVMEDQNLAVRLSLASAGIWWIVFTFLYPQRRLREREPLLKLPKNANYITHGIKAFIASLREMKNLYPKTMQYLIGYLVYNDGIQTVIAVATTYIVLEVGLPIEQALLIVLMIQFVASFGAYVFNKVAERIGAKSTIIVTLVIWCGIVIYAYAGITTQIEAWILGVLVAMVLGSSQALSRSLFAQMVPPSRESAYFSLYEISDRGTSWIGPMVFGFAVQATGSSRVAILLLIFFFIFGIIVLSLTNVRQAIIDAGNEAPTLV